MIVEELIFQTEEQEGSFIKWTKLLM